MRDIFKRILKYLIFISFYVMTGIIFFQCIPVSKELINMHRITGEILYFAPLWIINIVGGIVIGFLLKIFSTQNKGEIIAWLFLGCIISQFIYIVVLILNYMIAMLKFD